MLLVLVSICSVMSRDTCEVKNYEGVEAIRSTLLQQVRKGTASSSSSSADPDPKKPRAGSDAIKPHPQTPSSSYVSILYSIFTDIASVHF